MAIKINFDPNNVPEIPTFILTTKNGKNIGGIVPFDISFHDEFGQYSSFSFFVRKDDCKVWDDITNFKLVYYKESDEFYEIDVELDDSDKVVKVITATSIGYAELSQINLYEVEINTEDDIARDDYEVTVLYNKDNPKASLLDRITEKAPHYEIAYVSPTIASVQQVFTFDGTSIMDAFNEIAEEIGCVFMLRCGKTTGGEIYRKIYVYDLESYCNDCGKRTTAIGYCEHCGSKNLTPGYGEDTTILVTTDNLTDEIQFTTDTGSVKNCFRISGGDDYMTATIRNCNPNGSNYIWYIDEATRADMSDALRNKLSEYDEIYREYESGHTYTLDEDLVGKYNVLVQKYLQYKPELSELEYNLIGYPAVMNAIYDTIDFDLFLRNEFMPSVVTQDTDAEKELAKLTAENLSPIAVNSIKAASETTVNSTIESIIKIMVDARYKPEIVESAYTLDPSKEFGTWVGSFKVTNYSDEEDTASGESITLTINGDTETFLRQRIDRAIYQENKKSGDIVDLFSEDIGDFEESLTLYCLERLQSIYEACRACIDVLVEQGVADNATYPALYTDLYVPYLDRLQLIEEEIALREDEIAVVSGRYDIDGNLDVKGISNYLDDIRSETAEALDFEAYLGDKLWKEFSAYRREDDYSNSNYISDGLSNAEIFSLAREFLERARKDLLSSATMQHSINATLKNLLVIKEFAPIVDHFSTGNWIRVRVENDIYKLRLLSYDIDFNNLADLNVTFSDAYKTGDTRGAYDKMMQNLSSMSSSYGAVMKKSSRGSDGKDTLDSWQKDGISLTTQKIVNNANYQDVIYDEQGILLRKYIPESGVYDDAQAKIINQGFYVTTDNWKTARAGIGYFSYYDPFAKETVTSYGVIADTLVGDLILSKDVRIYNENGSIRMDKNGFVAKSANGEIAVLIQPNNERGIFVISGNGEDLLTVDLFGNLILKGYLSAADFSDSTGVTIDTDGFRLYGLVPIYTTASSDEVCCQIGYASDLSPYTSIDSDVGMLIKEMHENCYIAMNETGVYVTSGTGGIHLNGTVFIGNQTLAAYIRSIK